MLKRAIRGIAVRKQKFHSKLAFIKLNKLISQFEGDPDFPSSAGSDTQHFHQLVLGSKTSLKLLIEAVYALEKTAPNPIRKLIDSYPPDQESEKLNKLFDSYGSDKGTFHNYTSLYSALLRTTQNQKANILEIGLGTNRTDTLSNMGAHGIPGASLRAWRDYCEGANVIGCDIDSRVLFTEDRIKTFQLDQTSVISWSEFKENADVTSFDLIVDDGLHSPLANLQTIIQANELLKTQGYLIIEDIAPQSLVMWEILSMLLVRHWKIELLESTHSYVAVLSKRT
jgi:SAM-dependent methyltransferase